MLDLGWISFNSWAYLLGAFSALIPLLIHLSRSRRTKKMRFSTTRFFTDQFLRSYRMSRLREILLLVCRMALFALLAVALAQPLLKWNASALQSSKEDRTVILVVDNSASMNYTENDTTLLDRARAGARSVVENLKKGDRVGIVLAGRRAEGPEVLLEPTDQRNDAIQALDRISIVRREKGQPDHIRALGTDLQGALTRAEEMVKTSDPRGREIYVFSDLQATGWDRPEGPTAPADTSDISYVFVQTRPQQPVRQVAVTAVQFASPRPLVGVPFLFRPFLGLQGDLGSSALRLSLWVYEKDKDGLWIYERDKDGKDTRQRKARKVAEQEIQRLPSGRWNFPRLYHAFSAPGWQAGFVEVGRVAQNKDGVAEPAEAGPAAIDSRRYFALEVLESVKVLAVNGSPSQVPVQDELFFLRFGLTVSPEGQKSSIELEEIALANVAEKITDLDRFRAEFPLVILANVEALPDAALEKLEEYTARGGSLLFLLGDRVNAGHYNDNLASATRRLGGLLPGKLIKIDTTAGDAREAFTVSSAAYDHPALSAFADPKFASLNAINFKSLWRVEADPSAVLMRANNDAPLLCERNYGKGRVMLFASSCHRNWTNLPLKPAFLPFTHRLVSYLALQAGSQEAFATTGDVVTLFPTAPVGTPVLVKRPTGQTETPGNDAQTGELTFARADQPGVYSLVTPEQKEVGLFAVNLDSYESDLSYLDDNWTAELDSPDAGKRQAAIVTGLKQQLNRPLVSYVSDPTRWDESVTGTGRGARLWDWILVVVLLIGVFEPFLANQISARLIARKAPILNLPQPAAAQTALAHAETAEVAR
jgi:von Willebrand factor type A domain/Aerotolerance regulator N-terminal/Putative glutamine amidotransferase